MARAGGVETCLHGETWKPDYSRTAKHPQFVSSRSASWNSRRMRKPNCDTSRLKRLDVGSDVVVADVLRPVVMEIGPQEQTAADRRVGGDLLQDERP